MVMMNAWMDGRLYGIPPETKKVESLMGSSSGPTTSMKTLKESLRRCIAGLYGGALSRKSMQQLSHFCSCSVRRWAFARGSDPILQGIYNGRGHGHDSVLLHREHGGTTSGGR
jgi:hypothetical protein